MAGAKKAFILMPFSPPFDSYYPQIFKPALEAAGYTVSRADDIFTPQPIMLDIQQSIVEADLILCEMSGRNPNVFYELGLAHAIGKPAILISRKHDGNRGCETLLNVRPKVRLSLPSVGHRP